MAGIPSGKSDTDYTTRADGKQVVTTTEWIGEAVHVGDE